MTESNQFISIGTADLERYFKKDLRQLRGAMAGARRALMNNMAFAVRQIALDWGIPRVMTVRNPNILRATLRVKKATRADERAILYQTGKSGTWTALRAQERGGTMGQQPATLEARGGSERGKIKAKGKLRGGNILSPDDINVAHEKGEEHRLHVFLLMLQRGDRQVGGSGAYKRPFILGRTGRFRPGLFTFGRKVSQRVLREQYRTTRGLAKSARVKRSAIASKIGSRRISRLRSFGKERVSVRRLRWLKPSIDRYLRTADAKMEWRKAMRFAMRVRRA